MTWLFVVWTNVWKVCIQVLVHRWRGFMLKISLVELSPGSCPGRTPGRTIRCKTGPIQRGTELLYWRVFWRGAKTLRRATGHPVFSPVPPDWPSGRPAWTSAAPNLWPNLIASCFQRPDFHPHINTPSPSWGRVITSPTIVHLWSSHLPPLQKHQIP
jgi:hypothetical protein